MKNTTKTLGKTIQQIMNDNKETNVVETSIRKNHLKHFEPFDVKKKNFNKLKNLTKEEVIKRLGLVYNDIHSNIWMYRDSERATVFRKNFLYLTFINNRVQSIELRRFRRG